MVKLHRVQEDINDNIIEVIRWSVYNYDGEVIGTVDASSGTAKDACKIIVEDLLDMGTEQEVAKRTWNPRGHGYFVHTFWSSDSAVEEDENEIDMEDDAPCYALRRKGNTEFDANIILHASMVYTFSGYNWGKEVYLEESKLSLSDAETDDSSGDELIEKWANEIVDSLLKEMYPYWV